MLERDAMPDKGGHFWMEGGEILFRFVIDSGNVIGPRKATKADAERHPDIWQAFVAQGGLSPAIADEDAPALPKPKRSRKAQEADEAAAEEPAAPEPPQGAEPQ